MKSPRKSKIILALFLPWVAALLTACPNPDRGYMLQSDVSYMISPKMFERFVLPDLKMRCNAMDYAFFHMDGKGQLPHLEHLLSLDRLRGIQWQPGDGEPMAEEWPEAFPASQRENFCQLPSD